MDSPLPHIMESSDMAYSKPKDRLVSILDQIELKVEQLRRDALRLEEEKDNMLSTLDTLKNSDEYLDPLEDPDRDDILRYAERLSMRCLTVEVMVKVQRDDVQQDALHQVNGLIDSLVIALKNDPGSTRHRCAAFINACSSHVEGQGHSDKTLKLQFLGVPR